MITCITGHRGVGKTDLAKRLQIYFSDQEVDFLDLDEEIENKIKRPIFDIILSEGEPYFRNIEKQIFHELLQGVQRTTYIVLGAGFSVQNIPDDIRVMWVRRATDVDGRIFLDRPRLNRETSPLAEYQHRAGEREIFYAQRADFVYWMPEGPITRSIQAQKLEKQIFCGPTERTSASVTINRSWYRSENSWQMWMDHVSGRYKYLELRDDLLSEEQMLKALRSLPHESFLYSFRTSKTRLVQESNVKALDWALEQGEPTEEFWATNWTTRIVSWHGDFKEGVEALADYANKGVHLKLAPYINNWKDLWLGWQWQARDPKNRSFLPISMDQRWAWTRLLLKDRQLINFVKEGEGSAGDQPTLFQYLSVSKLQHQFAAVLGSPVYHSWSPLSQLDFFSKREIPFVAIKISEEEWVEAIGYLETMGLAYAAVTSPLKEKAQELTQQTEPINTLYRKQNKWLGTSSDATGFRLMMEGISALIASEDQIAIWGGGGVLTSLKSVIPRAKLFSARQSVERESQQPASFFKVEAVVWAAPQVAGLKWPPLEWKPKVVLDINYKEDSLGREYAQRCGCLYISGEEMFFGQAHGQRVFWGSHEEEGD